MHTSEWSERHQELAVVQNVERDSVLVSLGNDTRLAGN